MKKINLKNSIIIKAVSLCFLSSVIFTACSSDDSTIIPTEKDDDTPPTSANYNKLIRVENFADATEAKTLHYSLLNNAAVKSAQQKTDTWDLGFGGMIKSFVSGNNGADEKNYGAGGSGVGGIYIVEKPFNEVVDIPSDNVFKTSNDVYGTDENGSYGNGTGWYLYDAKGDIVADGSSNKTHVAYALGNPLPLKNGTTVPARTLIIKTAKGDYAKIKMISLYKNNYNYQDYVQSGEVAVTFEYVLVPKGSTKFEIK